MNQPTLSRRLVGTTEECFRNFIDGYPGLKAHALLAEFCLPADRDKEFVGIEKVHRWQRGEHFPGGSALLRLRCFLHLAGYDVTEFKKLNGDAQKLALIIGVLPDEISPEKASQALGYYTPDNPLNSLWRVLLQGGGYTDRVKDQIQILNRRYRRRSYDMAARWQGRIQDLFEELASPAGPPKPAEPTMPPGISIAFARLTAATTALGTTLLGDPERIKEALEATRGGHDLKELIATLEGFFSSEEDTKSTA